MDDQTSSNCRQYRDALRVLHFVANKASTIDRLVENVKMKNLRIVRTAAAVLIGIGVSSNPVFAGNHAALAKPGANLKAAAAVDQKANNAVAAAQAAGKKAADTLKAADKTAAVAAKAVTQAATKAATAADKQTAAAAKAATKAATAADKQTAAVAKAADKAAAANANAA
ncbi:MAG: hypothetical protein E6813_22235, partial [Bradyrhizobium sp.]|uniref:hypothetical protein n=1 Tax=Bradyrhizobium sp. TaxID=376 RepID=UPI0028FE510A